jgi:hypothetical protein
MLEEFPNIILDKAIRSFNKEIYNHLKTKIPKHNILLKAIDANRIDLIKDLLQDPEVDPSYNGNEALLTAAYSREITEILLKDPRVDVSVLSNNINKYSNEFIKILIKDYGVECEDSVIFNYQDLKKDPYFKPDMKLLNLAIKYELSDILYDILQYSSINISEYKIGYSPLHYAKTIINISIKNGHYKLFIFIMKLNIYKDIEAILRDSISYNRIDFAEYIVKNYTLGTRKYTFLFRSIEMFNLCKDFLNLNNIDLIKTYIFNSRYDLLIRLLPRVTISLGDSRNIFNSHMDVKFMKIFLYDFIRSNSTKTSKQYDWEYVINKCIDYNNYKSLDLILQKCPGIPFDSYMITKVIMKPNVNMFDSLLRYYKDFDISIIFNGLVTIIPDIIRERLIQDPRMIKHMDRFSWEYYKLYSEKFYSDFIDLPLDLVDIIQEFLFVNNN